MFLHPDTQRPDVEWRRHLHGNHRPTGERRNKKTSRNPVISAELKKTTGKKPLNTSASVTKDSTWCSSTFSTSAWEIRSCFNLYRFIEYTHFFLYINLLLTNSKYTIVHFTMYKHSPPAHRSEHRSREHAHGTIPIWNFTQCERRPRSILAEAKTRKNKRTNKEGDRRHGWGGMTRSDSRNKQEVSFPMGSKRSTVLPGHW